MNRCDSIPTTCLTFFVFVFSFSLFLSVLHDSLPSPQTLMASEMWEEKKHKVALNPMWFSLWINKEIGSNDMFFMRPLSEWSLLFFLCLFYSFHLPLSFRFSLEGGSKTRRETMMTMTETEANAAEGKIRNGRVEMEWQWVLLLLLLIYF